MKMSKAWRLGVGDVQVVRGPRQCPHMRRPLWIIVLVSIVIVFLIFAYIYPPQSSAACYMFSSEGCKISVWHPPAPAKEYTDEETASRIVIREILNTSIPSKNPKVGFMFLTPNSLPLEKLWDKFLQVRLNGNVIITITFVFTATSIWYIYFAPIINYTLMPLLLKLSLMNYYCGNSNLGCDNITTLYLSMYLYIFIYDLIIHFVPKLFFLISFQILHI